MRFALALALSLVFAAAAGAQPLAPGDSSRSLVHDGLTRTYELHVPPSYTGNDPVPLVLDYHGFSSFGAQQAVLSGFKELSDVEGFVVAYPDGVSNAHNGGICCISGIDDVGYARTLVARLKLDGNIDAARVYVTGLSNGGAMSHRLACEAADLFAAAAPMAFPISIDPTSACQPSRPIPVLTFMGLTDVLVPYAGGAFPSAQTTLDHWIETNECEDDDDVEHTESGLSFCDVYTDCEDDVQTGLCSITADSFGGSFFDGHILYLNPDYVLAEVAWDFLSQFALEDPPSCGLGPELALLLPGLFSLRGRRKGD